MKSDTRLLKWFAGLVIVCAVYYAFWMVAAVTLRSQAAQWVEAQGARGLHITSAPPSLAGFPLRVAVVFKDLHLAAAASASAQGWSWQADSVALTVTPFTLTHPVLDIAGQHTLTGFTDTPLLVSIGRGDIAFDPGGEGAHVQVAHLGGHDAAGGDSFTAEAIDVDIATLSEPAKTPAPTARVTVTIANLTLPAAPVPLPNTISKLSFVAELEGALAHGPLPEVLDAWRTGGGDLELQSIALDWPPLSLSGAGTLALDKALQPEGAFTAKCQGFLEVLDALVKGGQVQPNDAAMARGLLVLMAKTPAPGAQPELNLSLTIQNRKVTVGPVTLMEMPAIDWKKGFLVP